MISISQFIGILLLIAIVVTFYLEVIIPNLNQRKWKKLKLLKDEDEMKEEREKLVDEKQNEQEVYTTQKNILNYKKKLEKRLEDLKYNIEQHDSPGYKLRFEEDIIDDNAANVNNNINYNGDESVVGEQSNRQRDEKREKLVSEMESTRDSIARLIEDQDREYEEYLKMDIEREKQRQAKKQAQEDSLRRRKEHAQWLRDNMKPEPATNSNTTTHLLLRLPSGTTLKRKFTLSDTIQDVHNLVDSTEEFLEKEYYIATNHPKRTYQDKSKTLEESLLYPSATLFVIEK